MIKYIVSDLDGTLFEGHGETVFDLAIENEEAIERAKRVGIQIIPCSGRAIPYSLYLYNKYDFGTEVWIGGLNGAVVYHNQTVQEYALDINDVKRMIAIVKPHTDCYYNMQAQDMWDLRTYFSNQAEPYFRYKKEGAKTGCCSINEIELEQYIEMNPDFQIGKFSVISHTKEQSSYLEALLREEFEGKYAITRSSAIFLEVNNLQATKGNFIQCLLETGVKRDEIAVIGDSYNDVSMFEETPYSFAMKTAEDAVKEKASYCVESVAECIDWILKYN